MLGIPEETPPRVCGEGHFDLNLKLNEQQCQMIRWKETPWTHRLHQIRKRTDLDDAEKDNQTQAQIRSVLSGERKRTVQVFSKRLCIPLRSQESVDT